MAYKKILVPYDTSNPADNAIEHAANLAGPDSEVILLHVITEIPLYPVMEHAIKSRKEERRTLEGHVQHVYSALQNDAVKMLDEKKRQYAKGLKGIKTEVVLGRPVSKIVEYAQSKGVDLIVMGSTGYGGIAKKLRILGSVSKGVLEKAHCPVMIVH